ncbi:triose-phosphate isomerase [Candidatus Nomurabacteria bacterium RIFCSPLOWO2_01_FULL_39_18]|uniref:Triosephosphate isomerase n=1 Tax=Candidatus Nomurabacteria bacterium RIFCSPHIGHO2_01_FULL_40_24b TaxID=1801739 RepID=A0A1F6V8A8_9BACT|nr:MAG: triose-phosphate isomerase [Candidatus Nomurabacteria bacterium RIFCSPHIGHO2_01_FULL_40_24b]OGI88994.1 MAG: triose-phosphate isomerase [Candidatus Nomurabacteria bacterium RIFCSPLOWO2_01_FULL_39_18]
MTKKIIIGNWKMNPLTGKEAEKWFASIAKLVKRIKNTDIVICAPFIYLEKLKKISRKVALGAQDAFWGDVGPFTGEISPEMLYNIGVRYVILGHSERRAMGESSIEINKKIKSALASGLVPIVCIGEKERDLNHEYFRIVKTQIHECLKGIPKDSISKITIAYEPVWSLSSTLNRRDATANDSREMAVFIRKTLSDISSPDIASKTRVIYGGSANERDAEEFLQNGGVDGLLPGKASLDPKKFSEIVKIAEGIK